MTQTTPLKPLASRAFLSSSGYSSQAFIVALKQDNDVLFISFADEIVNKNISVNPRVSIYCEESQQRLSGILQKSIIANTAFDNTNNSKAVCLISALGLCYFCHASAT